MTIHVSVVVPTYQRPALLRRCLEALLAQDLHPTQFEVIVVADGPDVATCILVHSIMPSDPEGMPGPALRYLALPERGGPAAARNVGWRAARGEIVAFTDDDCIPDSGWLRAGCAAFAAGVAGASGRIVVPLTDVPSDYERNAAALEHALFATANCFYRRVVLQQVGGFDERFRAAWREDSDLFFALLQQHQRLVRVPDAVVTHPVRPAAWGVSIGQQRKSMYNALLYKKYPALYHEHLAPIRPYLYYPIVITLILSGVGLVRGNGRATQIAFSAWLLLSSVFCLQRLKQTSRSPNHVAEMIVTSAVIPPLAIFWRLRGALKFRVIFV
ncbi:MAG: glycosyltransferase [Pseudomonadota bacterium]|nr:glycosyltransferase [Chloroflexota bacterium]MDP9414324.1 glycosyltransferase [Pseudomonadota bacterium]